MFQDSFQVSIQHIHYTSLPDEKSEQKLPVDFVGADVNLIYAL